MSDYVTMRHYDANATGGPTTAQVPVEGIPMMRRAGWEMDTSPEGAAQPPTEQQDYDPPTSSSPPRAK